jgi:hypothetical protein
LRKKLKSVKKVTKLPALTVPIRNCQRLSLKAVHINAPIGNKNSPTEKIRTKASAKENAPNF